MNPVRIRREGQTFRRQQTHVHQPENGSTAYSREDASPVIAHSKVRRRHFDGEQHS